MKNEQVRAILPQLTVEEKLNFTTGNGNWQTASVPRLGLDPVVVSDGPVGLRKEVDGQTLPAVCFPSVSKLACSFDPSVLHQVGEALGVQCKSQNVDVLLAPGINIKRNPRCGRNFEYFSEDPFLTGELASAYVDGIQSQRVGVCVKHFAGNSQEFGRHVCDSVIDERALREIYLSAFERVIKRCRPCAVMCAYNKLNGEYCSQNKWLLTDVLRNEWHFEGAVMSDWGATDDRQKGIAAGLDLQMPQGEITDLRKAYNKGDLAVEDLDKAVSNVVGLALYAKQNRDDEQPSEEDVPDQNNTTEEEQPDPMEIQHALVGQISADTTVLAKNQCNLLPFSKKDKVALIGALAEKPHFQGGGSSKVVPYKVQGAKEGFQNSGVNFVYAAGYNLDGSDDEALLEEARNVASQCDKVVVVVGNIGAESEGYDRADVLLPACQLKVVDAVTSANSNVVAVVQCGSPVDLSWHHGCNALLIDYLPGENNSTLCDVIFGDICPTGRLAETWPNFPTLTDKTYSQNYKSQLYNESIYVGYRYYTTANVEVVFPFGHGLSYSKFRWSNVRISDDVVLPMGDLHITLDVENIGKFADADTVQVYLQNLEGRSFYAKKNLVGFAKVRLSPGEKQTVDIKINVADFASYDVKEHCFVVNGGKYMLTVAKNCQDEGTKLYVHVEGGNDTVDQSQDLACYYNIGADFDPTTEQFQALFGTLPQEHVTPFTRNSPLGDVTSTKLGKLTAYVWTKHSNDKRTLLSLPLAHFVHMRKDITAEIVDVLVDMLNGNMGKNLFKIVKLLIKKRIKGKK